MFGRCRYCGRRVLPFQGNKDGTYHLRCLTHCHSCGVYVGVFKLGDWDWLQRREDGSLRVLCPKCFRIMRDVPEEWRHTQLAQWRQIVKEVNKGKLAIPLKK